MGYRRTLLSRWTRRDRLAVLVIAVAVAFLTGTTLLITAAGTQTAAIATEFEAPGFASYHDSPSDARAAASSDDVVVTVATVSAPHGRSVVVGLPRRSTTSNAQSELDLTAPRIATRGTLARKRTVELDGARGTASLRVTPRPAERSIFPAGWYVTDASTVETLGTTGAFVVTPVSDGATGVPLLSALVFFARGTREALRMLSVGAVYAGVLVAVVVYSVTRMLVRDRLGTVRVVRATGGTPATVVGLFGARAAALTTVGVALGYAVGVILPRAATNVAVAVGFPVSLTLSVTPSVLQALAVPYLALPVVGGAAGALAAWPVAHGPPFAGSGDDRQRSPTRGGRAGLAERTRSRLAPRLLDWRTLIPTTATLSVFVTFVLLLASLAAAAGPMVASSDTTVTQPGSEHPVSSKVPEAYADALRDRGIAASPEILLFEVRDGRPFLARGVNFSAFSAVTTASLTSGRAPTGPREAVVGEDLARTLGVRVGDSITLGGSTSPAVTRVRIVGTYAAPGSLDDQLLVPLPTARHLSTVPSGAVNLVRAGRLPTAESTDAVEVVGLRASQTGSAGTRLRVDVSLRNYALEERNATVAVRFDGRRKRVTATVPPTSQRTLTTHFPARPGTYTLAAGNETRTVRVRDPDSLVLRDVPSRAPSDAAVFVRVETATGASVPNATVTVDDRTVRTNSNGSARLSLPSTGRYTVTAEKGSRTTSERVRVTTNAERTLSPTVSVTPSSPSMVTRPTARVSVRNPWATSLDRTLSVAAPGGPYRRHVALAPGEHRTLSVPLPRQPPGTYAISVRDAGGTVLARTNYTVTGDERVVAALATGGRSGTTGIGQAVAVAFGNLRVVLATLLLLAGAVAVGGTTATFAQAVHGRRRAVGVHRATGAGPLSVVRLILADAVRIGALGSVASCVLSLLALRAFAALGYLTVFGIAVSPTPPLVALLVAVVGAFTVAIVGAGVTAVGLAVTSPASLLAAAADAS